MYMYTTIHTYAIWYHRHGHMIWAIAIKIFIYLFLKSWKWGIVCSLFKRWSKTTTRTIIWWNKVEVAAGIPESLPPSSPAPLVHTIGKIAWFTKILSFSNQEEPNNRFASSVVHRRRFVWHQTFAPSLHCLFKESDILASIRPQTFLEPKKHSSLASWNSCPARVSAKGSKVVLEVQM